MLEWARANGCDWNLWTCAYAARGGHLDIIQWAREHGCRWSVHTTAAARSRDDTALLTWLLDHGCPDDEPPPVAASPSAPVVAAGELAALAPDSPTRVTVVDIQ